MTLLSIITNACNELGIPAPETVQTTADQRAVTLKALARREQIELARTHDWPSLLIEYTFDTRVGTQTYVLPTDVDKVLRDTSYNSAEWYRMRGSMTPAEWRYTVSNNDGLMSQQFRLRMHASLPEIDVVDPDGWTFNTGSITADVNGDLTFASVLNGGRAENTPVIDIEVGSTYRFDFTMVPAFGAANGAIRSVIGNTTGSTHFINDGAVIVSDTVVASTTDVPLFRQLNSTGGGNVVLSGISCTRIASASVFAFSIFPVPTIVEELVLEYKTNFTAYAGTVAKALMTDDTDTTRLDESLIELGLKWRWLKSRGLDYGEEFRTYTQAVDARYAQDLALPSVPLAPRRNTSDYSPMTNGYVPDRGYGP